MIITGFGHNKDIIFFDHIYIFYLIFIYIKSIYEKKNHSHIPSNFTVSGAGRSTFKMIEGLDKKKFLIKIICLVSANIKKSLKKKLTFMNYDPQGLL